MCMYDSYIIHTCKQSQAEVSLKKAPAGGQQGLGPKTLPDVEYGLSVYKGRSKLPDKPQLFLQTPKTPLYNSHIH